MGTPNREPQEYSMNVLEYEDPGRYIPIIFLLYSWGSLFGVPIRVPLFRDLGLREMGVSLCGPYDQDYGISGVYISRGPRSLGNSRLPWGSYM